MSNLTMPALTVSFRQRAFTTAELRGEFGIQAGALAAPGVALDRNFKGTSLCQLIQTGGDVADCPITAQNLTHS